MIAAFTALAMSAALQGAPEYNVEVMVQDKKGLFGSRAVRVSRSITLEPGEFEIDSGANPMLSGEIEMRGDAVRVKMVVCRPNTDPCDVVGRPTLRFRVGSEASVRDNGIRSTYQVTFEPE
ncbi:hypothetical protein HK107_13365 [Parvularcula sp. ZS-1/3]|uniref:Uncharacterized protein n=1 Tax=Parvularcula mediterranea TaxID=2732508 RepID=A0A7Y3RNH1_9PROT|nr:hypothetical protein [Parvularcula mediterranea]NNU17314.1 hypothetical protein [Parvularcula mediterranea]